MENKESKIATEKEIEVASKEILEKHHKAFENLADNERQENTCDKEQEKILDEAMEFLKQKMEEHVDVLKRLAKK